MMTDGFTVGQIQEALEGRAFLDLIRLFYKLYLLPIFSYEYLVSIEVEIIFNLGLEILCKNFELSNESFLPSKVL